MAKRGILDHEKTLALADTLGIMDCYAVGILEVFWHWVAKQKPNGDLSGVNPRFLARSIRYTEDAEILWAALKSCHLIDSLCDGRVLVHDWSEHADNSVHQLLKSRGQSFSDGSGPFTRNTTRAMKLSQLDCEVFTKDLCLPEPVASSHIPEPLPLASKTSSSNSDDDDKNKLDGWPALIADFKRVTQKDMTSKDEQWLRENMETRGITAEELLKLSRDNTAFRTPMAGLKWLVKNFQSKNKSKTDLENQLRHQNGFHEVKESVRCDMCLNTGRLSAGGYCSCRMGKDLERVEKRRIVAAQETTITSLGNGAK